MSQTEHIFKEAVAILQNVKILRDHVRASRPEPDPNAPLEWLSLANWSDKPILPSGQARPTDSVAEVYEDAIRFWAQRAAPHLSGKQFNEMAVRASDAVPDFPGDAIRFFENAFEGLQLRCGMRVWA